MRIGDNYTIKRRKPFFGLIVMTIVLWTMTGCIFGAERGPGPSNWKEQRIELSRFDLVFRVPDGTSNSVPPGPTISEVDLERDLTADKPGLGVFRHTWDYDGGWWKGVLGHLSVGVTVTTKPKTYEKDLTSLDNLQELIRLELGRTYSEKGQELREKHQTQFTIILPDDFNRVRVHDRNWITYSLGGTFDRTFYTTVLTGSHYITVTFDYVDNSRGYKTNWRKEAQSVGDKIAASLEIRERNR